MTSISALATVHAEGAFGTIGGLPLHPLAVHVVVVLLPLAALGLIAIVFLPKLRASLGWLVMAGLLIGAGGAFVAKESGEALAQWVGLPVEHADLGDKLMLVAFLLLICAAGWFWLQRQGSSGVLTTTLAAAAVALSIGTLVLSVLVGHTGAQAVWGGRIPASAGGTSSAAPAASSAPAATAAASAVASAPAAATGYTAAEVAKHNSPSDCWTIVNGNAYDVTQWINQHPGGPGVIEAMCGVDGSASFEGQHTGQRDPQRELASFLLGPVS